MPGVWRSCSARMPSGSPATPSSPDQTPCPSWATLPTRRCGQMRSTRLAFRWATFSFTRDGRSAFSIEATASAVTSYG